MKPVLGMAVDYYRMQGDNTHGEPLHGIVASFAPDFDAVDRPLVNLCVLNKDGHPMPVPFVRFVEENERLLADFCVPRVSAEVAELRKRVEALERWREMPALPATIGELRKFAQESSEFRPAVVSSQAVVVGDETPLE